MKGRTESRGFLLALLAAASLHVAIVVLLHEVPEQRLASKQTPLEVDLVELPRDEAKVEAPPPSRGRDEAETQSRGRPSPVVVTQPPVSTFSTSDEVEELLAVETPEGSTKDAPASEDTKPRPKIDLGIDAPLPFLFMENRLDNSPRVSNLSPSSRDVGGLKKGLLQSDVAKGLGRGGVVAQLGRGIVLELGPSAESSARFNITFGKKGEVRAITLAQASSNEQDWKRVREALLAALAKKPLPLLDGSNGYRIVMQLQVRDRLPSGAKKGAVDVHKDTWLTIDGTFDMADIGKNTVRTVSTRILSEAEL